LKSPLSLNWIFKPTHEPKPAWPSPGEELARTHFDNAHHVAAVNGLVYFGSTVDSKIYALEAASGKQRWIFFTEGPVRCAPTIWKNRIYFGSDDGFVYCLGARNGKLIWKYRAGPSDEKVLGNGRMISLWPVRTSVLVDESVVYFGAGVFPYEGVYICALDAVDGRVIWKNDTVGDRTHELSYGGISPQGYLIASENILYVPSGRAMPAAFGLKSGEFLYYILPGGKVGGTWALLSEGNLLTGVDLSGVPAKRAYDEQTGRSKDTRDDMHTWFPGTDLIITPGVSYTVTEDGVFALDREKYLVIRGRDLDVLTKKRQMLRSRRSELQSKLRRPGEEPEDAEEEFINPLLEEVEKQLLDLAEEEKRLKQSMFRWKYPHTKLSSLILAGTTLYAGGEGNLVALDTQDGQELWKSELKGSVQSLAVSDGNLYVSSDNGDILCFSKARISRAKEVSPEIHSSPYSRDKLSSLYKAAAEKILEETGKNRGYCLVLGCGTGRLVFELAKRSELKIIGIEENQDKVTEAKSRLDSAGLYGARVIVERWDLSTLPDYFADLIVSDEMMITGGIKGVPEEMFRVLKPFGGVAYFGQPVEAVKGKKSLDLKNLLEWLENSGAGEPTVIEEDGLWAKVTRGKLEGAGGWTEQYGNPQNTACSGDQLVRGPLGVLWFGDPGPEKMVERHAKSASPVAINGRLFIQGEEVIMAYDSYNGTLLWERKIEGAVRARADVDGGNLVATEDSLYVAARNKCYRLDPATGETVREYEVPPSPDGSPHRWAYVSFLDGLLYGSRAKPLKRDYFSLWDILVEAGKWRDSADIPPEYVEEYESFISLYPVPDEKVWADFKRSGALWRMMEDFPDWEIYKSMKGALTEKIMLSDMIFAMDPETGRLRWKHQGNKIAHITVSIGEGKIFFAENKISAGERKQALLDRQSLIREGIYEEDGTGKFSSRYADVRKVVCLDTASGRMLWGKPMDFTGCGGDGVATAYQDGTLLFFANMGDHDAWRFKEGTLRWKRLTVLSAKNGGALWSRPINYRTRPVIVGNLVFIEPRACDLHTGEIKMRTHPITGEPVPWEYLRPGHTCAISSASAHALFYRSYSTAIYDFSDDRGLVLFGGICRGCWINMLPANGVLLFPEASSGCTCSFPIRCSVVLKHKEKRTQPWSVYITHGALSPAKYFAVNFGAPGDMKDSDGNIWFAYPNPKTESLSNHFPNYGVKFDLKDDVQPGMGYFSSDFKSREIEGSDKPWLYTSGCAGLSRCSVPLIDDAWGEKPCVYTVRLGFSASSSDEAGQRVFDVLLQGDPVLQNFDILQDAGAPNTAVVKEFRNIKVENVLKVEFLSKEGSPTLRQTPLVNFIEIIREDGAQDSDAEKPAGRMTISTAQTFLRDAKMELNRKKPERALEKYHAVLDAAPSVSLKLQALEGMKAIGSPLSLNKIARYCRDIDPILWNYKEPDSKLRYNAAEVLIAIANNTAKENKQRAINILNNALAVANALNAERERQRRLAEVTPADEIYESIRTSLQHLGVRIQLQP